MSNISITDNQLNEMLEKLSLEKLKIYLKSYLIHLNMILILFQ